MLIEYVWERVKGLEGEQFRQIRGGQFTYKVKGDYIELSRTNRSVSKSTFKEALTHVPLNNTVPLQNLQAPSYLYAILMDKRVRKHDW
ncbi:hypothetical protein [Virgibacillus sp. L01]|uniref:hypothetical protein n=1 Tax=Virgibacillus sp. L01 TaxID=3457429 RepID=UPI003FD19530